MTASAPDMSVRLQIIKTRGDRIQDVSLAKVGGKGLFVKEIEAALLSGDIDLAVHSMKDMPADIPEGLCIGAIPPRENPADVLISRTGDTLSTLAPGAVVGTGSLRRSAQIRHHRPDLTIRLIRGNIDTRLNKLDTGGYDAVILAAAGMIRSGRTDRITEYIPPDTMLPAVGQGALCIEAREADTQMLPLIRRIDHEETRIVVTGERAFLKRLEGGCQVPIAAMGRLTGNRLVLRGLVADVNGKRLLSDEVEGGAGGAVDLGTNLAERLLESGALQILREIYHAPIEPVKR